MARVRVSIVHDELGRIVSIARPVKNVVVLGGDGQSVFETEVEEDNIQEMASGRYRVDVERNAVVDVRRQGRQDQPY
jgi:hypothetical protein